MKELSLRGFTGALLVLAIVGSIIIGKHAFGVLFFIITIFGAYEFYKMFDKTIHRAQKVFGSIISGLLYLVLYLIANEYINALYISLIAVLVFVIPIRELYRKSESPIVNISITVFGIIYVGMTFGLLNFLFYHGYKGAETFHFILAFFAVIWTSDTFAYLTGVSIGKHRLFERISPKKSWEGFFGGLIAAIAVGYIFSIFYTELSPIAWMGYALLLCIAGVYGDLVQSMFKRSLNLKDSGKILPGHGGILDRFDGVFLAVPVAIAYIMLIS